MDFLNHYTLKYTPLSPIHIGTGDSYEPTNYIIDGGTLYEFDTGGAVAAFSDRDRDELLKIVNGRSSEQMLKAVQKFFYDRREELKPWAVNAIPVLEGVAKLYASRIGQTANHESGGKSVINKLEIDRTAYNPVNRQPVLFGSSVKGAIRTALLNKENKGQRAREKKGLHEFQGRLLKYRDPERGRLELERDPLRLLGLSDAAWQPSNLPTSQVYLAVNRKKSPITDEKGQLRQAMGENLYQILECVPACQPRAFSGQLGIQQVGNRSHPALPDTALRYDINMIARACNDFYTRLFADEVQLMQQRGYLNAEWKNAAAQIFKLSESKRQANQAFLLRVGRHSGAEAVTVSGARNGNIKIMRGKGQQPEYADAPKTLWLAANDPKQRENLLPFGWLLVEILPDSEADNDWPELAAICANQHEPAKRWAEHQALQKAELASKRLAMMQKREQEATERRQREEQAQQAEQQRLDQQAKAEAEQRAEEKRLAELPPLEREIAQLLRDKKDPNKKDYLVLLDLAKSGHWQTEDQQTVLKKIQMLMQQAGDWKPTTQKKDPKKDKEHQRSLEVMKLLGN